MKFQAIGDIHLEFGHSIKLEKTADYLILCGDIGNPYKESYREFLKDCSKKYKKVFLIAGNHEFYGNEMSETIDMIKFVTSEFNNVHFLNNDYYDLGNVRIVGSTLWSNVDLNTNMISDNLRIFVENRLFEYRDAIRLFNENTQFLEKVINTTPDKDIIVITHHLPSFQMIMEKYSSFGSLNTHFASNAEHLFKPPVKAWVCGHSHGMMKKIINEIPCYLNAYGYPQENKDEGSLEFNFEI